MTEEKEILTQIQKLPEQLKREVVHYIEFLQTKHAAQNQKNKKRRAGSAKGKYELAPDFDAPLEDFKEYM
jgi:translation initiation factor 2 beta subunit (eIF-2beta)/eIF-5